jgi:hypothetical protein
MSVLRFTLRDNDGIIIFGTEKISNWSSIEAKLVRSATYKGRVAKITEPIQFVSDVRARIMSNFDNHGTNAKSFMLIEVGNDNLDEGSFTPLGDGFEMTVDYSGMVISEIDSGVMLKDSSFQERMINGEKEKLNLTTSTTLQGGGVTDWSTLLRDVTVRDRQLSLISRLVFDNSHSQAGALPDFQWQQAVNDAILLPIPAQIKFKSDDGVASPSVAFYQLLPEIKVADLASFIFDNKTPQAASVKINSKFTLKGSLNKSATAVISNLSVQIRVVHADADAFYVNETFHKYNVPITQSFNPFELDFNIDKEYDLILTGNSDFVQVVVDFKTNGIGAFPTLSGVTITQEDEENQQINIDGTSEFENTISQCILPHELFTHWIELMTGRKNAFRSNLFGRTDILDNNGVPLYEEDGEWAYLAMMDGHMLRNLDISENPMNLSFLEAFKELDSVLCLAGQVEYRGNEEVFRIEKYTDLLNINIGVDLGDTVAEVQRKVNLDRTFSDIKIGYEDKKPEALNGLEIVHGEINLSTPLESVDKSLDKVAKWIASDYIIEETRRKQQADFPTLDTKFDKNIFILDCIVKNDILMSRRVEDFVVGSISGILAPSKAMNLRIVPSRNLRRWGSYTGACLYTSLGNIIGEELVLTKSASNNILISQELTESEPIAEGENVIISKLQKPIEINETLTLGDVIVDKKKYDEIFLNVNKAISFTYKGQQFTGFSSITSYNPSTKSATVELNRTKS